MSRKLFYPAFETILTETGADGQVVDPDSIGVDRIYDDRRENCIKLNLNERLGILRLTFMIGREYLSAVGQWMKPDGRRYFAYERNRDCNRHCSHCRVPGQYNQEKELTLGGLRPAYVNLKRSR